MSLYVSVYCVLWQVYDWDQVGKDDFLGRFEVPAAKAPRRWRSDQMVRICSAFVIPYCHCFRYVLTLVPSV